MLTRIRTFLSQDVPPFALAVIEVLGLVLVLTATFVELNYEKPSSEVISAGETIAINRQILATYLMSQAAYMAASDSARADITFRHARTLMHSDAGESALGQALSSMYAFRSWAFVIGSALLLLARWAELIGRRTEARRT